MATPNRFIERTKSGVPAVAAHVERWAPASAPSRPRRFSFFRLPLNNSETALTFNRFACLRILPLAFEHVAFESKGRTRAP